VKHISESEVFVCYISICVTNSTGLIILPSLCVLLNAT
jgi:hypothetical protein